MSRCNAVESDSRMKQVVRLKENFQMYVTYTRCCRKEI